HLNLHSFPTRRSSDLTRRHFLQQSQVGLGAVALSSLLGDYSAAAAPVPGVVNPLAPKQPHFPAKAKQVIYLHMTGSPPNLDLWEDRKSTRLNSSHVAI